MNFETPLLRGGVFVCRIQLSNSPRIFVARMERSESRELLPPIVPNYASLHPGYAENQNAV